MKYSYILPALSILGSTMATIYGDYNTDWNPNSAGADYSTLTPTGTPLGDTDATGTYVIALETFDSGKNKFVKRSRKSYRGTNHKSKKSAKARFKAAKAKKHRKDAIVTQIGDGQIQAPAYDYDDDSYSCDPYVVTSYSSSCGKHYYTYQEDYNTEAVVTQIGDGQIQWSDDQDIPDAPVITETYSVCTQVPFYVTSQACTSTPTSVPPSCYQESDGQVYADISGSVYYDDSTLDSVCLSDSSFYFTVEEGILYDQQGRIGSIVSNTQFQFDGPPPQAGTIYAAGWSITDAYYLAYGDQTAFVACPQDDSFKIYIDYPYDSCFDVMVKVSQVADC